MIVHWLVVGAATIIAFLIAPFSASAQDLDFLPRGLGIEAGGGHNELMWWIEEGGSGHRRRIDLAPTLRLHYHRTLAGPVALMPFVGYNVTGGRSAPGDAAGGADGTYRDHFRFWMIEAGNFATVNLGPIAFGLGVKGSRILKAKQVFTVEADGVRQSHEGSMDWFRSWSSSAGLRLERGEGRLVFSAEGWMGLTNLEDGSFSSLIDVRENHYRVLVGYRLN